MTRLPLAVTTGNHPRYDILKHAQTCAEKWGLPFLARPPRLEMLFEKAESLLVVRQKGTSLYDEKGSVAFTPGLAMLRVKRLDEGVSQADHLLSFGEIRPGDSVLDCTLGLAADAFVAARAVGPQGNVVGLEKSAAVYAVVSDGLERYDMGPNACRIRVVHADAAEFLKSQATAAFDVVVFDPMFERPRKSSPAFELLRRHADHSPLEKETLVEAQRVARRWVLVKGSRYSSDLKKLGLMPLPASRSSTVVWGRLPGIVPSRSP